MDKLLVVNKEKNLTSRDIVNNLTKIFNTKKIGHTGTLDPIATGVLVCLFGKYTKLVDLLTSLDKEYIAEIKLGIKTDTGDITGSIIENKSFNITKDNIIKVFEKFPQKYEQTVPKYSAVKINGKKLYEYAKNNIEIDLPESEVSTFFFLLIDCKKDIIVSRVEEYCKNKGYKYITIDGVKVLYDDGFALVRKSNTTPNITARYEAKTKERLEEIINEYTSLLNKLKEE